MNIKVNSLVYAVINGDGEIALFYNKKDAEREIVAYTGNEPGAWAFDDGDEDDDGNIYEIQECVIH